VPSSHVVPTRRSRVLRIVTPAALLLGYADLVRGGMTAGPVLLVLGYLVLIPATLLVER
jgi:hypothetical protein